MTNMNPRRLFYVVKFIELPFEEIDDYVCVPKSWLILQRLSNPKVFIAYPNKEDPFDTKDRVKKKEKPNDKWGYYLATIEYESDDYKDIEYWIASRNDSGSCEKKSETKDTQPEPGLDKKLRSTSQLLWSGDHFLKPQLVVKPYKNPRKLLPQISTKRPSTQKLDKNLDSKQSKFHGNDKPASINNPDSMSFRVSKKIRSRTITVDTLINNDQIKTSYSSNAEMDTEENTQPNSIKKNQSDRMIISSSSTKHPTQQPSSKLSTKQQSLSDRDDQQAFNAVVINLDDTDPNIEFCDESDLADRALEKRLPAKTHPNTLEPTSQFELVNKKSIRLAHHENSLPQLHPQTASVGKSMEPKYNQKADFHRILTSPPTVLRSSSTPVINNSNLKSSIPKTIGINSTKAVHNIQRPCTSHFVGNLPSTSRDDTWQKVPSPFTPVAKGQASAGKNPRNLTNKKTRLENITKNISTLQNPPHSMVQLSLPNGSVIMQDLLPAHNQLQQAQLDASLVNNMRCCSREKYINQNDTNLLGIMNSSASQNLMNLAPHYYPLSTSGDQQNLSSQEDHLQQFLRLQDMLQRKAMIQPVDPRAYNQNPMMDGGLVISGQSNLINQPVQFLPQNPNHCIPVNRAYTQEVIGHELMSEPICGVNNTYTSNVQNELNPQPAVRNPPNQSHRYSDHPQQKQDQPNRQDSYTPSTHRRQSLESKRRHCGDECQIITKKLRSPSTSESSQVFNIQKNILLHELGLQRKTECSSDNNAMNLLTVPEKLMAERKTTTQSPEARRTPLADQPHETQSSLVRNNDVDQHRHTNKSLVETTTETKLTTNVEQYLDMITKRLGTENASKVVDNVRQMNKLLEEDRESPFQETSSDSDAAVEQEMESENDEVVEDNSTDLAKEKETTVEDQQIKSPVVDEKILDLFETLFNQMGANLSHIRDMYNFVRDSILVCNQTYDTILERINKINLTALSQQNLLVTQVTQVRLTRDNNDGTGVDNVTKPISKKKGMFSLPEEYDPHDTSWTRKYREMKPGLVELLPQSGVYVDKKELKRCKKESTDCRSLARSLLTEVFSKNALSVCSLTGGKAKAFNALNIDVRPGLDKLARIVLLAFVESYGNERGWASDMTGVISSIRTKINDIRAKHVKKSNF